MRLDLVFSLYYYLFYTMETATTKQEMRVDQGKRHMFTGSESGGHFEHEVLHVDRVVRVVKGGRRFRFRASVVVGDRAGRVGFGLGKSKDVQSAIQKAQAQAVKNIISVSLVGTTIAYPVIAKCNGTEVLLRPARPGTGIIAGATVRIVADLMGIRDLVAKTYGSTNKINNARAVIMALESFNRTTGR